MQVMSQVAVLFLLILCGYVATKTGLMQESGIKGLNSMVMYFSLPCMIVEKLQQDANPQLIRELAVIFVAGAAVMAISGGIAWFLAFRKENQARRAVFTNMAMFPNCGYMGFPVLIAAFGADNLIYGVIYMAIFNILNWSIGIRIYDRTSLDLKRIVRNPSLIASVLGVVLFVTGIRLPSILLTAMGNLGSMTTPLAMFIIGSRLIELKWSDLRDPQMLLACALRLLVLPMLTWLVLRPFALSGIVNATIVLCTAMPCAASLVIQAENYHGDSELASRGVALSTILSIATIPLFLLII